MNGERAGKPCAFFFVCPAAILAGLLAGAACGAFNGFFVAYVRAPAFIATMAMLNTARGVAYLMTNAEPIRCSVKAFTNLGAGRLGIVPLPVIYAAVWIVMVARMYSGQPAVASGWEMDAVAASALGGVSLMRGSGSVVSAMIGVLIIGVLKNGLNLLNVNSFWQLIAQGLVVLAAVSMDMVKQRKI